MRTLRYFVGLGLMVWLFSGCDEVDDAPPRLTDISTSFILPALPRLTVAEREIVQERINAYNEAIGNE